MVRKPAFWASALQAPLDQRIGAAPAELLEFVSLDNIFQQIPDRPRAASLPEDFMVDVRSAFRELPAKVKALLAPKLAGIYFIEGLGGTGFSDVIWNDEKTKPVAGFVLLDASVLRGMTANGWASWKENSPFTPQAGYSLEAKIEEAAFSNRKNAIQYILLHELGHVLSVRGDIHPSWNLEPKDIASTTAFPFFELSWKTDRAGNRYVSKFEDVLPLRSKTVYYFGAKLQANQMVDAYDALARTNYPSLYASLNPGDDFAESFASYVHTVLMGRPFAIRLLQDGKVVKTFGACWSEPRCADKRKILDSLFAD
ncbi:MAG: hypothetical protein HY255_02785 [Betaproteobacteria bacterium]|nr:hypothetical protein [Betaproteobacteria bacterium]